MLVRIWRAHRRWVVLGLVAAIALLAGAVRIAWVRRTAPPWPAVAGIAYDIVLGSDGCPIIDPQRGFVDAPGQFVPPDATEVMLCARDNGPPSPGPAPTDSTKSLVLRAGAADLVALLNRLPDRNESWRRFQRKHSGWWPDAAPIQACALFQAPYSFVLRYPDRPPVAIVDTCGGLTTGVRTRIDDAKPHVVDEFRRLLAQ